MNNQNNQTKNAQLVDKSTRFNIDFMGKRRIYYAISITLIVLGILVSVIFSVKLDIAFKGGAITKYSYTGADVNKDVIQGIAKNVLKADVSVETADVAVNSTKQITIDSDKSADSTTLAELLTQLQAKYPDNNIASKGTNDVDAAMGKQFLTNSILEVLLASFLIIIYVWFRFRKIGGLPAGITAFIALLHDVVIVFAAFSIFRIPINENFIAVVLLVLGYSINDTIVVYDRIRENRTIFGSKLHFRDIVNKSINQSFVRSINTTLVTFVAITVVLVFSIIFHIDSIFSFALPMMVGVVTGCYSTICIAGPLWVTWVEYKEKKNPPKNAAQRLTPKRANP
jgi:preprotein translocase subunit SecF